MQARAPRLSRAGGTRKVPARYASASETPTALAEALRAHRRGDVAVAIRHYREHLAATDGSLDGWLNLGSCLAQLGNAAQAREALTRAAALDSYAGSAQQRARAWRDIGIGLMTIGEVSEALAALRRSVETDPLQVGAWMHLARLAVDSGDRPIALEASAQAVALRPDDASAHWLRARCVFHDDERRGAVEALRRAAACKPARPEAAQLAEVLTGGKPLGSVRAESTTPRRENNGTSASEAYADALDYMATQMAGARLFAGRFETLEHAAQLAAPGAVLELGVRHGVSLRWLSQLCPEKVHGFDSFQGLPESWLGAPAGTFSTERQLPRGVDAQLWVGDFEDQLPKYVRWHLKHRGQEVISLLHLDCDIYRSARIGLECLAPLLGRTTIVLLDEYFGHRTWRSDEYRAFSEIRKIRGWCYQYLGASPFTGQAIVRLDA